MGHLLGMGTHTFVRLQFIPRFFAFSIALRLRVLTLSFNFLSRASTTFGSDHSLDRVPAAPICAQLGSIPA